MAHGPLSSQDIFNILYQRNQPLDSQTKNLLFNELTLHLLYLEKRRKISRKETKKRKEYSQIKGPGGLNMNQIQSLIQKSETLDIQTKRVISPEKVQELQQSFHPFHLGIENITNVQWE